MYDKVYGIGGIGYGILFKLESNHTLGRDESRLGFLTDYKDYCKCHIILHYIAVLSDAKVYPMGIVGCDQIGENILSDMKKFGLDIQYIKKDPEVPTMFAVCFQYPDGSGGNITTKNSACNLVDETFIDSCMFDPDASTIILAVPEVSLASRKSMLKRGKQAGSFCAASFLSAEAQDFIQLHMPELCDLIAINIDEALALIKHGNSKAEIAKKAAERLQEINPNLSVIVTAGSEGAYLFHQHSQAFIPAEKTKVISTAGCGDALLGGTLAALIQGKTLEEAVCYGSKVARFAVESPDSIALALTKEMIDDAL